MTSNQDRLRSVLIFGGAGFIGSNLAHSLLEQTEAKIHIFDNLSRAGVRHNLEWLQRQAGSSGRLEITVGDVRDATLVERAVRSATEIYHFAAQVAVTSSLVDPRLDFDVNLGGTFNVLEAIRKAGHRPFLLFTSTNKVYGELRGRATVATSTRYRFADGAGVAEDQPLDFYSPYGCSKGAADQYVRDYARMFDIPAVVFRMSCIAGPRQFGNEDQGWVAHFLYSALAGQPVVVYGDGRQVRDVLSVSDLVRAFAVAHKNSQVGAGEIYNVGGGARNTVSLLELIDAIEQLAGRKLHTIFQRPRPGDQLVYVTDFSKLQRQAGWEPQYNPLQTLEQIYAWWKRNRHLFPKPQTSDAARISAVLQELPGAA